MRLLPLGDELASTVLDREREENEDRPMSATAFPPLALPSSGSAVGGRGLATLSARLPPSSRSRLVVGGLL